MENTIKELKVYSVAVQLSDLAWNIFTLIPKQFQYSTGDQFIRASDSVAANISEGYGRFSYKERLHYTRVARGSLHESSHWFEVICKRFTIPPEMQKAFMSLLRDEGFLLNQYGRYLQNKAIK